MTSHLRHFTSLEVCIDRIAHVLLGQMPRHRLSEVLIEFLVFGLKQAWACIFGGAMVSLILITKFIWDKNGSSDFLLARYDFLFIAALAIQLCMLVFRLETREEAKVIFIFHIVGTVMEIFKTRAGSWVYPEHNLLRIGEVPLFSGCMYAAIGSYMARINRIFDICFTRYPPFSTTMFLAAVIYINFFTHHYLPDPRIILFGFTALLYGPVSMHYRVFRFHHKMPLLLAFFLVSFFIWFAENIGTWSQTWMYPGQTTQWAPVSLSKLGSWYLLMIISVVLVTRVHPPRTFNDEIGKQARVC